jgi:hypothetical protein
MAAVSISYPRTVYVFNVIKSVDTQAMARGVSTRLPSRNPVFPLQKLVINETPNK